MPGWCSMMIPLTAKARFENLPLACHRKQKQQSLKTAQNSITIENVGPESGPCRHPPANRGRVTLSHGATILGIG